ncbi:transposable element Tcb1 transposase [Trichonephila clavipes]|nr:transposable element Tcb1 transposase [Trichonephila clavipes]
MSLPGRSCGLGAPRVTAAIKNGFIADCQQTGTLSDHRIRMWSKLAFVLLRNLALTPDVMVRSNISYYHREIGSRVGRNQTMWPMVAQRLTQITPPAAIPDQLWQRVEAAFGLLYPKNTSKVSLNQCRGVWQR